MRQLNVLFTWRVPEEVLRIVSETDPRIRVAAAPYVEPEERRDLRRKGRLNELDRYPAPLTQELRDGLREAEVIYGLDFPSNLPMLAPRLKWVQMIGAGVDHLGGGSGLFESNVMITKMAGFSSLNIAEYCVTLMLVRLKHLKEFILAQPKKGWDRIWVDSPQGKTVGIVGYGRIGSEVARLCKPFGMRVLATRRTPGETPPHVDNMYPASALHEMLPQCDFVVVSVALTPETRGLIGQRELQLMKPAAYLINVARGEVVDEDALIEALRSKTIAGAGLDVFRVEPLPPSSPLWEMPNVIVTPHTSAAIANYAAHSARAFAENLRRYLNGQPLLNMVDKKKGY